MAPDWIRFRPRIIAITALACVSGCSPQTTSPAAMPSDLVSVLGHQDAERDFQTIERLASTPRESAIALVDALQEVNPVEGYESEMPVHDQAVIQKIRALRYVTGGLDFCSTAGNLNNLRTELEPELRSYWLRFRHRDCAAFFAIWPSRDMIFVAPAEAQREIIAKWREWAETEAASYSFKPLSNPAPETWIY